MKRVLNPSIIALLLAGQALALGQRSQTRTKPPARVPLSASVIAQKTLRSVVVIIATDPNGETVTLGSGFFVTADIIATNYHVIENASQVYAKRLDLNRQFTILGSMGIDEKNDLALLKVGGAVRDSSDADLFEFKLPQPLSLAAGYEGEVGDDVYVVGNPEGYEGTFSKGIISALRGNDYIQVTAPISPGSSGGPVVDRFGQVIGIATLFNAEGQNLNFAIRVRKLLPLLSNLSTVRALRPKFNLGFDGLYGATFKKINGEEVVQWFRFHKDGSVFATWANPESNRRNIFEGLADGGNRHAYRGQYSLRRLSIQIVLKLGASTDSTYTGTLLTNGLRLTERSLSGTETTADYGFVKISP